MTFFKTFFGAIHSRYGYASDARITQVFRPKQFYIIRERIRFIA